MIDSAFVGMETNPISREFTPIHTWEKEGSYLLPSVNVELILCNQRVNKKMCVRYVMIDPEFFILIEPDFSVKNENRIVIHQKVPLRHVESMVDKGDDRNLQIGFAVFFQNPKQASMSQSFSNPNQSSQKATNHFTTMEILLYFEN